jgi:hypothetical protein
MIIVVIVVHPPCAADAIDDVDDVACLVRAAPGGSRQTLNEINAKVLEDLYKTTIN